MNKKVNRKIIELRESGKSFEQIGLEVGLSKWEVKQTYDTIADLSDFYTDDWED